MTNKYYVDGSFDSNGKIVVRDLETKEVVVKVSSIDNLYVWGMSDSDNYFKEKYGITIDEYLKENGRCVGVILI